MSLVAHARRELELSGQFAEDPAYAQAIVAAVAAFASYGHSGGSAGVGIHQLTTLLQFGTLSPLTDDPDEWQHITDADGGLWQNSRNSKAFSNDGGKTYYLLSDREAGRTVRRRSIMSHALVEKLRLRSRGVDAPGDGPEPACPVAWAVND